MRARASTDQTGGFSLELDPGEYSIVFEAVEGLLGTPQPIDVKVGPMPIDLGTVTYDTGIR